MRDDQEEYDRLVLEHEREAIAQYVEIWTRAYAKRAVLRVCSLEEIGMELATAIRERHRTRRSRNAAHHHGT